MLETVLGVTVPLTLVPYYSPVVEFITEIDVSLGLLIFCYVFIASVIFMRSLASPLASGHIKLLLSYPIRRSELFAVKFLVNFAVLSGTFTSIYLFKLTYLMGLSPGLAYNLALALLTELLLLCALPFFVALLTASTTGAMLLPFFAIVGFEWIAARNQALSFVSPVDRNLVAASYLLALEEGRLDAFYLEYTAGDLALAFVFPIALSLLLLALSWLRFHRMDLD